MKKIIVWICIMMLLLAACTGAPTAPETESVGEAEPAAAEAESVEPTEEAVAEIKPTGAPAEEAVTEAEPTEAPAEEIADIGPPPEFSPDLKATNPDNVVLGNGKPQVVEFFAFW